MKLLELKRAILHTVKAKFVQFLLNRNAKDNFVEIVDLVTEAEETEDDEILASPTKKAKMATDLDVNGKRMVELMKMEDFKMSVDELDQTEAEYFEELLRMKTSPAASPPHQQQIQTELQQQTQHHHQSSSSSEDENCDEDNSIPLAVFNQFRENVSSNMNRASRKLGEWSVDRLEDDGVSLSISAGSGATRKMSFILPDVSAVLNYAFILRGDSCSPTFEINGNAVHPAYVKKFFLDHYSKGILNLLYQLSVIRPCFGLFNPELVETVEKSLLEKQEHHNAYKNVYIDHNFIGSSQNSRVYAGTVRSRTCKVSQFLPVGCLIK